MVLEHISHENIGSIGNFVGDNILSKTSVCDIHMFVRCNVTANFMKNCVCVNTHMW